MGRRTASAFPFDLDGNLLEEPLTRHEVRRYAWDAENQMVETWVERRKCRQGGHEEDRDGWQEEGDEDDPAADHRQGPRSPHRRFLQRYGYGSDGLKVRTQAFQGRPERLSETSLRFWDSGAIAEERIFSEKGCRGHHESHAPHRDRRELADRRHYVRSAGGRIVAELKDPVREGALAGTGHGASAGSAKADRFYLHDILGSTVATAGLSLKDLESFSFDPWGNLVKGEEAARDVRHLFTGAAREDAEPGQAGEDELYAMQYRHLRPGLGKWSARDPAGTVDTANLFAYARSRPLIGTDLSGLLAALDLDYTVRVWAYPSRDRTELSAQLQMIDLRMRSAVAEAANFFGSKLGARGISVTLSYIAGHSREFDAAAATKESSEFYLETADLSHLAKTYATSFNDINVFVPFFPRLGPDPFGATAGSTPFGSPEAHYAGWTDRPRDTGRPAIMIAGNQPSLSDTLIHELGHFWINGNAGLRHDDHLDCNGKARNNNIMSTPETSTTFGRNLDPDQLNAIRGSLGIGP